MLILCKIMYKIYYIICIFNKTPYIITVINRQHYDFYSTEFIENDSNTR